MAAYRKHVKDIPQRTKDLLNGYIRWIEQRLDDSTIIADDIKYLCLLFFLNQNDEWNNHNINSLISIDGNKAIMNIDWYHCGNVSIYLNNVVKHGKHVWLFRYIASHPQQRPKYGTIGIHKISYHQNTTEHFANSSKLRDVLATGYSLTTRGRLSNPTNPHRSGREFYVRILPNDMIEMILDFNQLTLSYIINGNDRGDESIAFGHVDECEYRAAVGMKINGNKVCGSGWELISYCSSY